MSASANKTQTSALVRVLEPSDTYLMVVVPAYGDATIIVVHQTNAEDARSIAEKEVRSNSKAPASGTCSACDKPWSAPILSPCHIHIEGTKDYVTKGLASVLSVVYAGDTKAEQILMERATKEISPFDEKKGLAVIVSWLDKVCDSECADKRYATANAALDRVIVKQKKNIRTILKSASNIYLTDSTMADSLSGDAKSDIKQLMSQSIVSACQSSCGSIHAPRKICSRCRATVYYCNRTCQAKDWPRHKTACVSPVKVVSR